jgi:cellulose synthase/poly-beta-1,6-N-acetylglucosamine synthase-like glycosyltransferase
MRRVKLSFADLKVDFCDREVAIKQVEELTKKLIGELKRLVNLSMFYHLYYWYCIFYEFFALTLLFIHVSFIIIIIDFRSISACFSSHP